MLIKKRKHTVHHNNLLLEELVYKGSNDISTLIEKITFDNDLFERQNINFDNLDIAKDTKTTWIQVKGLSNTKLIGKLCEQFYIPKLIVQDILNIHHIAKIEVVSELVFVVTDLFSYSTDNSLMNEHICIILGKNFVISFQESDNNHFDLVEKALETKQGQIRRQHADYLFNLLISIIIDQYLEVLEVQQNLLLDLEDSLMEFKSYRSEAGKSLQNHRRDYSLLKKSIWPIKEQFGQLLLWNYTLINKQNHIYFHDTNDHLQQAYMMVEGNRETIASILDLYLANNDLRMNHIMKQLTVVSTIFIPLTFLVGVWGMNFRFMPELDWKYGYLFSWIIMIIAGAASYIYFRKKKWY